MRKFLILVLLAGCKTQQPTLILPPVPPAQSFPVHPLPQRLVPQEIIPQNTIPQNFPVSPQPVPQQPILIPVPQQTAEKTETYWKSIATAVIGIWAAGGFAAYAKNRAKENAIT